VQKDLKRMLAYSSIAHGGYMMVAVAAYAHVRLYDPSLFETIHNAVIMYLLAYSLMNIIAFGVIAGLGTGAEIPIRQWRGLAKKRPGVAAALALSMVSLTGIPPTVGFIGKFYVFQLAVEVGLIPLAILAMLMSVVWRSTTCAWSWLSIWKRPSRKCRAVCWLPCPTAASSPWACPPDFCSYSASCRSSSLSCDAFPIPCECG